MFIGFYRLLHLYDQEMNRGALHDGQVPRQVQQGQGHRWQPFLPLRRVDGLEIVREEADLPSSTFTDLES